MLVCMVTFVCVLLLQELSAQSVFQAVLPGAESECVPFGGASSLEPTEPLKDSLPDSPQQAWYVSHTPQLLEMFSNTLVFYTGGILLPSVGS